ncbi:MAG: methyltransferase domain-containing protein [Leptospirales bacterium]
MPDANFWNGRYLDKNTGWDLGQVSPPVVHLVESGSLAPYSSILIPGAGRGWEALYFARLGFDVTCVDFAPEAVVEGRALAKEHGVRVTYLEEDLFRLSPETHGRFDYLFEQTCFCAIDPDRREDYVKMASRMVRPGGELLGLFYVHGREGGPPWTTTSEEVRELFRANFDFIEFAITPHSVESRKGEEILARLRRRGF